jgi:hypothetical protein
MKHHLRVMLALAVCTAVASAGQAIAVQTQTGAGRSQSRALSPRNPFVQQTAGGDAEPGPQLVEGQPGNAHSDGFDTHLFGHEVFPPRSYCDEGHVADGYYGSASGWNGGYCDACGGQTFDGGCWCRGGWRENLLGVDCRRGEYFFTADYLYVRANFSEAPAFLEQVDDQQGVGTDEFHELDFQYESSYRVGGGYRLSHCDDEIRFLFTRLSSYANDLAPFGSFVPFEVTAPPGGETRIRADVDVKVYDLEFAKATAFGQGTGCDCGDVCDYGNGYGCGDVCSSGCECPAWEVTWSGGLRFADASWHRTYTAVDANEFITTNAASLMDFRGGGVRVGLEGRRNLLRNGCLSVYLKGDISLLLGDVDLNAVRVTDDPTTPDPVDTQITQSSETRQIIPVTEIETGLTGHVTRSTSVTAGYIFSAWHDLGFRDDFNFPTLMETRYDDANILGFDGFFARLEMAY